MLGLARFAPFPPSDPPLLFPSKRKGGSHPHLSSPSSEEGEGREGEANA